MMDALLLDVNRLRRDLRGGAELNPARYATAEVKALCADLASRQAVPPEPPTAALRHMADLARDLDRAAGRAEALEALVRRLRHPMRVRAAALVLRQRGAHSRVRPAEVAGEWDDRAREVLNQHAEEGILDWALREGRACLVPSFEDRAEGDIILLSLHGGGKCAGLVWMPCALRQEQITADLEAGLKVAAALAAGCLLRPEPGTPAG